MKENQMVRFLKNYFKHYPTAVIANIINGSFNRKPIIFIGVTGTDGKTTTVNMIYKILKDAGKKVSMISTINAVIGDKSYDTGFHVTNPGPFQVQNLIKQAVDFGSEIMLLEVTSQGLDQFRVWGVRFDIGVITNVTHEHLDYHKNLEKYRDAKAKLIKNVKWAVLNMDDNNFNVLKNKTSGKVVSFSLNKNSTINKKNFPLRLKIPGDYNISNALAAAAVAQKIGIKDSQIKKSLENFDSLSGRMEEVPNNKGIRIIIDFAHTPNALEQALKTLKEQTKGKLIAVFGAASERDITKRPVMGEAAAKNADIIILTSEDPRFENPNKIIDEIASGALRAGALDNTNLFKVPQRKVAIRMALSKAKAGDTVGIFGKGHEQSMSIKGVETPWSDRKAVEEALNG